MATNASLGAAQGTDVLGTMTGVTISREYGSGGGEVAARLARRLGWRLVDHEVVSQIARRLGVQVADVAAHDEEVAGLAERVRGALDALGSIADTMVGTLEHVPGDRAAEPPEERTAGSPGSAPPAAGLRPRSYHEALRQVVTEAAERGRVVIVGRGAQVLLAGRRDVLHARVVAPLEQRVAYVMRREGLGEAAARARIQRKERARARYLQAHYRRRPDEAHLHDLVVNTGVLGLDDAVELLALALARKAARIAVPEEELGPAGGVGRYPGAPGDFSAPQGDVAPEEGD